MDGSAMIQVKQLDYHIVDACNLACEFCTHYSNFRGPANILSPEAIEMEWGPWAQKIVPHHINLIGGEPLLNPGIVDIVRLAFCTWPSSVICLYSNGLLLKRHPGLRGVLKGGRYVLGLHYGDSRDKETEAFVRDFFLDTGVQVNVVDGMKGWLQFYKISDTGDLLPFADNDQRSSWENCVAAQQRCFVLKDSRLWKCPQVAYAKRAGISWFDDYESCGIDGDIESWIRLEDEACCKNCPAAERFTGHGAGFMTLRMPRIATP